MTTDINGRGKVTAILKCRPEITEYVLRWILASVFRPTSLNTAHVTKDMQHIQCRKWEEGWVADAPVLPSVFLSARKHYRNNVPSTLSSDT